MTSSTRVLFRYGVCQRGISLVVCMLMLLVLTTLGVIAMDAGMIESLMASNSQYQTFALNKAENSLPVAENFIDTNISGTGFDFSQTDGYYVLDTSSTVDPAANHWSFDTETVYSGTEPIGEYIIEYAGPRTLTGESSALRPAIAGSAVHFYRVTVRASDARGALRILQTLYATRQSP